MKSLYLSVFFCFFLTTQVISQSFVGQTTSRLNFRKGPSTSFEIIEVLPKGKKMFVFSEEPTENFFHVLDVATNQEGYVYSSHFEILDVIPRYSFKKGEFEDSLKNVQADLQIYNSSNKRLYLKLNESIYDFFPKEKVEILIFPGELNYVASIPGNMPIYGIELIHPNQKYFWEFRTTKNETGLDTISFALSETGLVIEPPSPPEEEEEPKEIKIDTTKVVEFQVHPQDAQAAKYRIDIRGYVKTNTFYDFNGMKNTEGFLPFEIPVDEALNQELQGLYMGARQSRFNIESSANTKYGRILTFIEGDFAGDGPGLNFRLRHAYGKLGYLTIGHTWTNFTDLESMPSVVDNEGPNSAVWTRHGLIKYERKIEGKYEFGLSAESPLTDVTNPFDTVRAESRQRNFDFSGRIKFDTDKGHWQVAGVFRTISYKNINQTEKVETGLGALISGTLKLNDYSRLLFQGIWGKGIARFITGLSGRGLDAIPDQEGNLTALPTRGGFVAYEYNWNPRVYSTLIVGGNHIKNTEDQPESSYKSSGYSSVNTFIQILPNLQCGAEIVWGRRKNKDGATGHAQRAQLMARFSF
ncbi:DcaP family trimeric outer membrane transporter [Flexithrix dorotheae]|uniref:DcaP family trimeric outer membrane transporter n=1 Tax=Flexithrix dorotheae TaxID=70993 RepID=UPI000361BD72|nr:DcaP family trimeric outer membrane transporter [Flexithrix dorotheae]